MKIIECPECGSNRNVTIGRKTYCKKCYSTLVTSPRKKKKRGKNKMEIVFFSLLITLAVKIYDVIKEKNEEIKSLKISNASFRNMAVEEGLLPESYRVDNLKVIIKNSD